MVTTNRTIDLQLLPSFKEGLDYEINSVVVVRIVDIKSCIWKIKAIDVNRRHILWPEGSIDAFVGELSRAILCVSVINIWIDKDAFFKGAGWLKISSALGIVEVAAWHLGAIELRSSRIAIKGQSWR